MRLIVIINLEEENRLLNFARYNSYTSPGRREREIATLTNSSAPNVPLVRSIADRTLRDHPDARGLYTREEKKHNRKSKGGTELSRLSYARAISGSQPIRCSANTSTDKRETSREVAITRNPWQACKFYTRPTASGCREQNDIRNKSVGL